MHKINFLDEMKNGHYLSGVYHKPKRTKVLQFLTFFLLISSLLLFSFSWKVFSAYQDNKQSSDIANNQKTGIISNLGKSIKNLVSFSGFKIGDKKNLMEEKGDRINVLLLGIGGAGHDGAYLSDTNIIASVELSTKRVSLISIPRDLYVPIGEQGWHKINHADAYGEANKVGGGPILASETVSKIFNIPIDYYVRVDFDGFKQIINDIGGVDIYVENSFSDDQYPDSNYGYEPLSFTVGWENMDGNRALKYARSRHGNNGEGSDFARSKRQQKVLTAVKDKLSDFHFWLNPNKVGQVLADLDNHIITNMSTEEIIALAQIVKGSNLENINHIVLTDGPDGQLYSTIINGEYVLLPKGNDFTPLKILAKNIFGEDNVNTEVKKDIVSIKIQNGTIIPGLGLKKANELKQEGFLISGIENASEQNYKETVMYDLTQNTNPEKIKFIEDKFLAKLETNIPSQLISENIGDINVNTPNNLTDIVIILGENANN